jgi:site-specific recombinase XerD
MAPADDLLVGRVEDFLAGLQAAKRSQHTIGAYRDDLMGVAARIACQLHGPDASVQRLAIGELDARTMRQAFAAWASDHAAASMVRVWGTFNRFFGYLIDDEALDRNPMKAVPKPKLAVTAPRAIRQENVAETLLVAAGTPDPSSKRSKRWPERDVALVALFCVTGIRLAEGIALRLDSITGPPGARRLHVTGKGKKERMIPLQPGLEAVLERYLHSRTERHGPDALTDPAAALLVHYDNTPLTRGRVQYVIEQLYRRAGLTAAVPAGALVHALRHSFASLAIEYGTDVAELRDLLGHASLATTSRYLDANTSRLREAVAAHPSQRALDQHR